MNNNENYQFLPAAIEVEETPPNPTARKFIWLLIAFIVFALAWALFGRVDIVAIAPGKVVVSDRTKLIQPTELGVVRAIHVRDGSSVKAGDVLIELDTTMTEADVHRVQNELQAVEHELTRYQSFAHYLAGTRAQAMGKQDREIVSETVVEYRNRRESIEQQMVAKKNEREAALQTVKKLEATLPLIEKRAAGLKTLADKKVVAEVMWLEIEQARIETQQNLAVAKAQWTGSHAAIDQMYAQLNGLDAEYRKNTLEKIAQLQQQQRSLQQENIKADQRHALHVLRAPVAGVVQQLAVHTIGGVVNPAEKLMVIVPQGEGIEIEALLPNKDIGFIRPGLDAAVKVDAFPFTRYGTIKGKVISVSQDAIPHEQLGLVFATRIALDTQQMKVDGQVIALSSGMSTVNEIITGNRTLMDYLLSPLRSRMNEAARER